MIEQFQRPRVVAQPARASPGHHPVSRSGVKRCSSTICTSSTQMPWSVLPSGDWSRRDFRKLQHCVALDVKRDTLLALYPTRIPKVTPGNHAIQSISKTTRRNLRHTPIGPYKVITTSEAWIWYAGSIVQGGRREHRPYILGAARLGITMSWPR